MKSSKQKNDREAVILSPNPIGTKDLLINVNTTTSKTNMEKPPENWGIYNEDDSKSYSNTNLERNFDIENAVPEKPEEKEEKKEEKTEEPQQTQQPEKEPEKENKTKESQEIPEERLEALGKDIATKLGEDRLFFLQENTFEEDFLKWQKQMEALYDFDAFKNLSKNEQKKIIEILENYLSDTSETIEYEKKYLESADEQMKDQGKQGLEFHQSLQRAIIARLQIYNNIYQSEKPEEKKEEKTEESQKTSEQQPKEEKTPETHPIQPPEKPLKNIKTQVYNLIDGAKVVFDSKELDPVAKKELLDQYSFQLAKLLNIPFESVYLPELITDNAKLDQLIDKLSTEEGKEKPEEPQQTPKQQPKERPETQSTQPPEKPSENSVKKNIDESRKILNDRSLDFQKQVELLKDIEQYLSKVLNLSPEKINLRKLTKMTPEELNEWLNAVKIITKPEVQEQLNKPETKTLLKQGVEALQKSNTEKHEGKPPAWLEKAKETAKTGALALGAGAGILPIIIFFLLFFGLNKIAGIEIGGEGKGKK